MIFITDDNGIKIKINDHLALAESLLDVKEGKVKFDREKIRKSVLIKYGKKAFTERIKQVYDSI